MSLFDDDKHLSPLRRELFVHHHNRPLDWQWARAFLGGYCCFIVFGFLLIVAIWVVLFLLELFYGPRLGVFVMFVHMTWTMVMGFCSYFLFAFVVPVSLVVSFHRPIYHVPTLKQYKIAAITIIAFSVISVFGVIFLLFPPLFERMSQDPIGLFLPIAFLGVYIGPSLIFIAIVFPSQYIHGLAGMYLYRQNLKRTFNELEEEIFDYLDEYLTKQEHERSFGVTGEGDKEPNPKATPTKSIGLLFAILYCIPVGVTGVWVQLFTDSIHSSTPLFLISLLGNGIFSVLITLIFLFWYKRWNENQET